MVNYFVMFFYEHEYFTISTFCYVTELRYGTQLQNLEIILERKLHLDDALVTLITEFRYYENMYFILYKEIKQVLIQV